MGTVRRKLLISTLAALLLVPNCLLAQTERVVYVTVESNKRDFIKGLTAEHFKVSDGGIETKVTSFNSSPEPVSVGFLFDVSASVLSLRSRDVNEAARTIYQLVKARRENFEFFLLGFNKETKLMSDWTVDAERIAEGLKQLQSLQTRPNNRVTSLHAAVLEGLKKANQGKFRKKALVVFSDGQDSSRTSPKELMHAVLESDALIYFVSVTEPSAQFYIAGAKSGPELIDDLTRASGGKSFSAPSTLPENRSKVFVGNADSRLREAFENVFRELDSQYALTFTPRTDSAQARVRSLDIKVDIPSELKNGSGTVRVRSRKKYRLAE